MHATNIDQQRRKHALRTGGARQPLLFVADGQHDDEATGGDCNFVSAKNGVAQIQQQWCRENGPGGTVVLTNDGTVRFCELITPWTSEGEILEIESPLKPGRRPAKITAGFCFQALLTSDGALYTSGDGDFGVLGHGDEEYATSFRQVMALARTRILQVACGSAHIMALTSANTVVAWGDNEVGQLGIGESVEECHLPSLVANVGNKVVSQIAANSFHSAAVTQCGELYTWGEGCDGELGHGDTDDCYTPRLVTALSEQVKQVACGESHTAAVTQAGAIYTFGKNDEGQLGHNDTRKRSTPTLIQGTDNCPFVEIGCGASHCVGLTTAGQVYLWGSGYGPLGNPLKRLLAPKEVVVSPLHACVTHVEATGRFTLCTCTPAPDDAPFEELVTTTPVEGTGPCTRTTATTTTPPDDIPLKESMRAMVNKEATADVVFTFEEEAKVFAHRCILAQRSEHFGAIFGSGMPQEREEVAIRDTPRHVFLKVLEYLYAGDVKVEDDGEEDDDAVVELCLAAERYGLARLCDRCGAAFARRLTAANAVALLQKVAHCPPLEELCLEFLAEHFRWLSSEAFEQLTSAQLRDINKRMFHFH